MTDRLSHPFRALRFWGNIELKISPFRLISFLDVLANVLLAIGIVLILVVVLWSEVLHDQWLSHLLRLSIIERVFRGSFKTSAIRAHSLRVNDYFRIDLLNIGTKRMLDFVRIVSVLVVINLSPILEDQRLPHLDHFFVLRV